MSEAKITERALAQAMKELMAEHSFAKISVQNICCQCGISRKSFYYHFRDKYDLVNWIFYTEFLSLIADKEYADAWEYLADICDYLDKNRHFYLNALSVSSQNSFEEYFYEVGRPYLLDFIEEAFRGNDMLWRHRSFFADIPLQNVIRWLQNEQDMTPQQFIATAQEVLSSIVKMIGQQSENKAQPKPNDQS